jgi:DNA polymerase III subunit delta
MQAMEFVRTAESFEPKPVYALFGDEAFLRREALSGIARSALGPDYDELACTKFPGETASLADVFDEVRTLPFLAKARVVVVENADPFVTAHRRELEAFAEKPSRSGHLILSVKSWPSNTKLAKLVEKVGLAIDCKSPSVRELPSWLISLAKVRSRVALDRNAADLLLELVGPEVGLLATEVEKLAVYVGERKQIVRDDVAAMVGAGQAQKIWSAIQAATTGDGERALHTLDLLFSANESPHEMLGAIRFSLLKTYQAGMLRRAKMDAREACKEAGIYPGAVEATLKQHAHLGPERVEQLPSKLLQAELDLKGASQLPPRVILERLFAEFARPRRD